MQIEYSLTPDDWAAFGEYHARNSPGVQRAKNRALLNGISLALSIGVATCIVVKSVVPLVIAACAATGWSWNSSGRLVARVRTHMTSKERSCFRGRHILEALPAGLRSKCDITDSTVAWVGVREVIETSDHIFMMLDDCKDTLFLSSAFSLATYVTSCLKSRNFELRTRRDESNPRREHLRAA